MEECAQFILKRLDLNDILPLFYFCKSIGYYSFLFDLLDVSLQDKEVIK